MYVDQTNKIMTSKILRNFLLSETFIAGGPKVNLVNEEKRTDAQKKRRRKPHQRESKATGRG